MSYERKRHILKATLIYGGFTIIMVVLCLACIIFKPDLFEYLCVVVLSAALVVMLVFFRCPKGFSKRGLLYQLWIITGCLLCSVIIRWDYIFNNEVITIVRHLLLPIWFLILTLIYTYRYTKYHKLKDNQ
jgi:hypothetical protein